MTKKKKHNESEPSTEWDHSSKIIKEISALAWYTEKKYLKFFGIHVDVRAFGVVLFGVLKHLFKVVLETFQGGVCSVVDFPLDSIQRNGSSDL